MTRVLVVSDTHGDERALWQALEEQPAARLVFHLGDGAREAEAVAARCPDRRFQIVRGNNDWGSFGQFPETGLEIVAGKRIFYTHGHQYGVKMGLYRAVCAARERQADVLLFGHTHQPLVDYEDGLHILNPGSLSYGRPTYGLLDITEAGIVPHTVSLRS
ncbi:MAG TPA: metallophosphoesterase [Firmicutes bacterium]|nr:metallophosphoesterase [Bacillota bacterium]